MDILGISLPRVSIIRPSESVWDCCFDHCTWPKAEKSKQSREELLEDPDTLDALVTLGTSHYNNGATDRPTWLVSLYADLEDIAKGLGDDLEPVFSIVWRSITGETDYVGGVGGIYGAE